MLKAWQLVVFQNKNLLRNRPLKKLCDSIVGTIIGVALFVFVSDRINSVNTEGQFIAFQIMLLTVLFFGTMYTTIISFNSWFASADSFYFISRPLRFVEMYLFHWLNIGLKLSLIFGHLILPGLIAFGFKIFGLTGALVSLIAFLALLSVSINVGFFLMFYIICNKEKIWALALLTLGIVGTIGLLVYVRLSNPMTFVVLSVLVCSLLHIIPIWYGKKVFKCCLGAPI